METSKIKLPVVQYVRLHDLVNERVRIKYQGQTLQGTITGTTHEKPILLCVLMGATERFVPIDKISEVHVLST